ncbi:hypothetical protein BC826DRAFT_986708 [Russula brevipes]|nr:hypothetical protein BC826DRAFT_986708 [Russula brevipes]
MQAQACGSFMGCTNKLADACYGFWCWSRSRRVRAFRLPPPVLFPLRKILIRCSHGAPNAAPRTPKSEIGRGECEA